MTHLLLFLESPEIVDVLDPSEEIAEGFMLVNSAD